MDARMVLSVFAVACALLATTASGHNVARSSEKYNVTMEATSSAYQTLGSGRANFTFNCSVSGPNGTVQHPSIKLMISGDADHKKSAKVTKSATKTGTDFAYPITNYTDDQTMFSCLYENNNQTWASRHNLTLTVFYGPQLMLVNKTKIHGDNNTNASIVIQIVANPPIENYTWTMNGENLSNSSNVMVMPCGLCFMPLLADFMGNYTVQECNNISCSSLTFPLYVYYAPLFVGNLRNASLLTEIATGHNGSLTATVANYSGPDPLHLTLTNHIPHAKYNKTNASSITLTITNASQSDAVNYTFLACTGKQPKYCSYLRFPTYVGGPPIASAIDISCRPMTGDTQFNISCNVTDRNLAPVTMLQFNMPSLNWTTTLYFNTTDQVPIDNTFSAVFNGSLDSVFAGNYTLKVGAGNQLSTNFSQVYTTEVFVAGLKNVTIQAENSQYQTLGEGKEFKFSCSVNLKDGPVDNPDITLAILGSGNSAEKLAKVNITKSKHAVNFTYHITNYTDDHTVFVCQYNHSNPPLHSRDLNLTVFYGPQLTLVNKTKIHGDNNTNASVVIQMVANPPIKNYTWTMGGKNLSNSSNVMVMPSGLCFTPLLANSMGNYTVQECNNVSCSNLTFPLYVYYAPLFAGNLRNASLLTEIAMGHNKSLTATVANYSGPDPLHLTLTNHIPPSKYNQTNVSSITLTITNASQSDAVDYTFLACTGKQPKYCSYLSFLTYVGGRPDNATLLVESVLVSPSTNGTYNLTIVGNFTDRSEVPVTQIKFVINETGTSSNISVQAPLDGETQMIQSSEIINASQLKGKAFINVDVYAVNDLGSLPVAMVKATLPLVSSTSPAVPSTSPAVPSTSTPEPTASPTSSPAKSNTGVIVVAVLVPLAFIAFLIVAAIGGYIYYKKRAHPKGFTRLVPSNDDPNDVNDGVYDAT